MKFNINKILLLIMVLVMGLTGCNKKPVMYTLEVPDDQMKVTASSTELFLERANADQDAVTFTWNDATDRCHGTKLTYMFRLFQTMNKDNSSEIIRMEEGQRSITWTTRQLNDLLASWGINPGEDVSVTAEVIAQVTVSYEYMKPELSFAEFKVTGYNPSSVMYMIFGEGENIRSYPMTSTIADENLFIWTGELPQGDYYFASETTPGTPAYFNDGQGGLVYSAEGTGTKFSNSEQNPYEITLNIGSNVSISQEKIARKVYFFAEVDGQVMSQAADIRDLGMRWYMLNVPLPEGAKVWASFNEDGSDPFTFEEDNVKVISDKSQASSLTKMRGESNIFAMSLVLKSKKFITRDLILQSSTIYPVGDVIASVSNDWDQGHSWGYFSGNGFFAQKDMMRPEVFSLTLDFKLNDREGFKLLTENSWGNCYHPTTPASDPTQGWQGMRLNNGGDDKWKPNVTGRWTIEADFHNMRLRMIQ